MTTDIEALLSQVGDEPVGSAPTAHIVRAARRRRFTRRATAVAAVVAFAGGLVVLVPRLGDDPQSDLIASAIEGESDTTVGTSTSTSAGPTTSAVVTPSDQPPTVDPSSPETMPPSNADQQRQVYERMVADRESVRQGTLTAPELESAGASSGRFDLALADAAPFAITVGLPSATPEAVEWFTARYGGELRFEVHERAIGARPSPEGAALWGRMFEAVSASDAGQPRDVPNGARIAFDNDEARVTWSGGCNDIGGWVTITADRLDVGWEVAGTQKLCDDSSVQMDQWMTDLMTSDAHWQLAGDRLTVSNGDKVLDLVLASS